MRETTCYVGSFLSNNDITRLLGSSRICIMTKVCILISPDISTAVTGLCSIVPGICKSHGGDARL